VDHTIYKSERDSLPNGCSRSCLQHPKQAWTTPETTLKMAPPNYVHHTTLSFEKPRQALCPLSAWSPFLSLAMLSRVEDTRVFESSEDVIFASSGRHRPRVRSQQQLETHEDEKLHPQHPYRMRRRVLQQENGEFNASVGQDEQELTSFSRQDQQPMQFVFLSSGEIRAREDCPPGLALPKLQYGQRFRQPQKPRLQYEESDAESDSDEEVDRRQHSRLDRQKTAGQPRRTPRMAASPSSSSSGPASSESDDADISSDEESDLAASKLSDAAGNQETEAREQRRQGLRSAEHQDRGHGRWATKPARNGVKRMPTHSLKLDHLRVEEEEGSAGRGSSSRRTADLRDEKASSSQATPRGSSQRPAPLENVSQWEDPHDVPTRRTKRSPKMEVSHLVSEEPTPKPKGTAASSARKEEEMIDRLESELQKEKTRVLEKMSQLLDEQGKNQQLQDRVEALEAQLAGKDDETNNRLREAARKQELQRVSTDTDQAARMSALEEQARAQEAKIARDKEQLKTVLKQLKNAGSSPSKQHSDVQDSAVLRAELDAMTRRLHDFLVKVERWKNSSKEAMGSCDDKTSLPALLEQVWLDFPQFPETSYKGDPSPSSQQQQATPGADEQADAVLFLKKRLRQREDELRQTHVKYVELKELCARQCVRETDLQNFINEHRLRGNLIIRKSSGPEPNGTGSSQEQPQDKRQDDRRRSAKLKLISSRGTNTPAFHERDDDGDAFVNDDYSDNQDDNDDYEEEEEYEYPVRAPKVFVQVGHEGVYEHASPSNSAVAQKLAVERSRGKRKTQLKQHQQQPQRVERIRLTPSPRLAQRYERVPTPTANSARRKKSAQQQLPQHSSKPHQPTLGECPPGCGSRLSSTRRKAPCTAAGPKPVKRPVATTASKGAIGVIRPWM
jgi:hypothetical protein